MKHVRKTVLLWYSPAEMYALVTDVPRYPQFLPWCAAAEVLQSHEDGVTARLSMAYGGVRQSFTTRNVQTPAEQLRMSLVDGPFSTLDGLWRFVPLQQGDGAGAAQACKIEFELRYAFSSKVLEALVSPVFDRIANTLVECFVKRAEQVYGPR
ncbi:type II toxin-antitoxin system RatA family toxin [Roseateles sp. BYS180W]|uniref:Type II toxin-antitoxin system RatA family toxin n=1 Tax=Roseateles rivi TaxID=3299028 RepID=A0ABW7FZ14_9BURK